MKDSGSVAREINIERSVDRERKSSQEEYKVKLARKQRLKEG